MTTAPPTRAVANLHLHLEYDSGLDVIAAAMAAIPDGGEDTDEHRGHVAGDISSAVAHLLDIDAITPEGCPIRVTEVSMEVAVDLEEPEELRPEERTPEDLAELRAEAEEVFGRLAMSEDDISVLAQAETVAESAGPPPFELAPENLTDIPVFIAEWGLVCGYFARACEGGIDALFDDMEIVAAARASGHPIQWGEQTVKLPEHRTQSYTPLFYRKLIVTMTDVTTSIVAGWQGPATLAQALAMNALFDVTRKLAFIDGVQLREDMLAELADRVGRQDLVEAMFEGKDPPVRFENWFVPLDEDAVLAPYATDYLD